MTTNNQLLNQIACLSDYRLHAKEQLSEQAWAYIDGASADEITKYQNQAELQKIYLKTRVLSELDQSDASTTLLGTTYPHPILLAPVAYQKLACADGELATVQAADAQQTPMVVSTLSSTRLEDIANQSPNAELWFQLYVQHDQEFTRNLIKQAELSGYKALVITVDTPVNGLRNREQRASFTLPNDIKAVNLQGLPAFKSKPNSSTFENIMSSAPTWQTIEWLIKQTSLPVLIKGIMSAEDATIAVDIGVDGIIVSNHGGRALDTQPATIQVLPSIAKAVNGHCSILLDGGISRGTDIVKAKALGADAILIGRPLMYALATAGAMGVAHSLRILKDELQLSMALCGYSRFRDIDASCIHQLD